MDISFHHDAESLDWDQIKQDLIADDFHNGRTTEQLEASFKNSQMQVYAMDQNRCIGTARALSDGIGNAYVINVWTNNTYRNQGVAREMMERMLACGPGQHFYLQTDDAIEFYRKLGFSEQPLGMSLVVGEYLENDSR